MSLRTKFTLLLSLLGLAVVMSLAAAWWSVETVQREVRDPMRSMSASLSSLGRSKRSLEAAGSTLGDRGFHDSVASTAVEHLSEKAVAALRADVAAAATAVEPIHDDDWARTRVGTTAITNLRRRMLDATRAASQPEVATDLSKRRALLIALFDLHELIERMETRIVEDAQTALAFAAELRQQLLVVLAGSFLITALAIALGLSLVRRWVLAPVQNLRLATAKFAAGDLTYRVQVNAAGSGGDELIALSREVNHMAGTVESLQNERIDRERLAAVGEMVRRLAHNLRNPLGGIRGLAELTRAEVGTLGPAADDIKEHQSRIIATVDRFESWLTDLLTATRPTAVELQASQVHSWLVGLVEAHRAAAQTRGVDLALSFDQGPSQAVFDPRHLEHALSALVSNAIDASSQPGTGGRVLVRSGTTQGEHGQLWELRVTDSGPGVPAHLRDKIFAPYFTTKRDGNGIGLAVAMQVVKAHGGIIEVESSFPEQENRAARPSGASFVIRLPLDNGVRGHREVARIGQTGETGGQDPRH